MTGFKVKARRMPMGGALFALPDTDKLALLWMGPGSHRLHLVSDYPGGIMVPVDHPSGHLAADTLKAATDGAQAFVDAGNDDQ